MGGPGQDQSKDKSGWAATNHTVVLVLAYLVLGDRKKGLDHKARDK